MKKSCSAGARTPVDLGRFVASQPLLSPSQLDTLHNVQQLTSRRLPPPGHAQGPPSQAKAWLPLVPRPSRLLRTALPTAMALRRQQNKSYWSEPTKEVSTAFTRLGAR